MRIKAEVETALEAEERNEQESIHQFKNSGLSEIAALYVTAYRFAQDEAAMLEVIANPADSSALWNTARRAFPTEIDPAMAARARKLVAAYRPAVLRDSAALTYEKDRVDLAEKSLEDAQNFLTRIGRQGNAIGASATPSAAAMTAKIYDLSHYVRDRTGAPERADMR